MAIDIGTSAEQPNVSGISPVPGYGEKAVGLTFNPSGNPDVLKLKELYAEIINMLNTFRINEGQPSEKGRLLSVAITEAQTAQMWAVKGVTYTS